MRIKIISIGKKIRSWEKESIEYYLKQLPKNFSIDLINIGGLQHPKISKKEIIEKESKLLMEKISKEDYVVAWDSFGEKINSETLASFLSENFEINNSICFLLNCANAFSHKTGSTNLGITTFGMYWLVAPITMIASGGFHKACCRFINLIAVSSGFNENLLFENSHSTRLIK